MTKPKRCTVCHRKIYVMIYRFTDVCSENCRKAKLEAHLEAMEANYEKWTNRNA